MTNTLQKIKQKDVINSRGVREQEEENWSPGGKEGHSESRQSTFDLNLTEAMGKPRGRKTSNSKWRPLKAGAHPGFCNDCLQYIMPTSGVSFCDTEHSTPFFPAGIYHQ